MIRGLTSGEISLGREAFGGDLQYDTVRFLAAPRPLARAFVAGRWFGRDWIVWPADSLSPDIATAPVPLQATLIHELTHVWQVQRGVNLLTGKLRAGDRPDSYAYPTGMDCRWDDLNIEQQAMVVEHRFSLSRGGTVPGDREFYQGLCPFGHQPEL